MTAPVTNVTTFSNEANDIFPSFLCLFNAFDLVIPKPKNTNRFMIHAINKPYLNNGEIF
jgi:hypothetical protein